MLESAWAISSCFLSYSFYRAAFLVLGIFLASEPSLFCPRAEAKECICSKGAESYLIISGFRDLSFDLTYLLFNENAKADWSWVKQGERGAACYGLGFLGPR